MVDPRNRTAADLAETLDVAARDIDRIAERIDAARTRITARADSLEAGQIVQRGTHEELVKAGGRYAALYA